MKLFLPVLATLLLASGAMAHEGHDHDGPVTVQAPKGGTIKKLDESYIEVVSKGAGLSVFFYDKDLKPLDAKTFTVTAKALKPRSKKTEEIKLESKDLALEGSYEAKGAHRYTLILSVKDSHEDHADTVKFTIEPKK